MKKVIIGIIIGIVICTGTVLGTNYLYQASEVSYTPEDSEFDVDNVEGAINDLYDISSNKFKGILLIDNLPNFYQNIYDSVYYINSVGKISYTYFDGRSNEAGSYSRTYEYITATLRRQNNNSYLDIVALSDIEIASASSFVDPSTLTKETLKKGETKTFTINLIYGGTFMLFVNR